MPPLEIVYHDVTRSRDLDGHIRDQASGLAEVCPDISACRVTVESARARGRLQVSLQVTLPRSEELLALRVPGEAATPVYDVVDGVFDSALRQLRTRRDVQVARRMEVLTAL